MSIRKVNEADVRGGIPLAGGPGPIPADAGQIVRDAHAAIVAAQEKGLRWQALACTLVRRMGGSAVVTVEAGRDELTRVKESPVLAFDEDAMEWTITVAPFKDAVEEADAS